MTPTAKTIKKWLGEEIGKDKLTPKQVEKLLQDSFTKDSDVQSYGRRIEAVLKTYDELVGNFGLESIASNNSWVHFWLDTVLVYSNTGDTYDITLTYDVRQDKFKFQSWGSFAEFHRGLK